MRHSAQHALPQAHLNRHDLGIARFQDHRRAIEAGHGSTVELTQQIREVWRHDIDERRRSAERLTFGECTTLADRRGCEGDIAMPRVRQRARVRGQIFGRLLRQRLVHLLAIAFDRMGGADVRARRHGRDIGGDGEDEAGGRRARAGWCDEDRHRRSRDDHPGHDRPRGIDQPTRCAQREDHEARPCGVRAVDHVNHVVRRDGVDDAVDDGGVDHGCVGCVGCVGRGAGTRGGEGGNARRPNRQGQAERL